MNIYFDTEFTGLRKDTDLISIGCISEDGETFYGECNDYDKTKCDQWLKENVISELIHDNHLDKWEEGVADHQVYGTRKEVMYALKDWLQQFDSIQLVSDVCYYDMVLFIDLFGHADDIPKSIAPCCHDINQDISAYFGITEKEAFDLNRENILEMLGVEIDSINKHNSLYDANIIRGIYQNMILLVLQGPTPYKE